MKLPVIRTEVQVRYSDTDAMGHISNESYITFMQVGRLQYHDELHRLSGYNDTSVVANLNIDFLNECFYGDRIEVVTWCARVGNKSLTLNSEIFANGKTVAKGAATIVGFDTTTRQSKPLPTNWEASDYPNPAAV